MTIPNDPLGRQWAELSDANPALVAQLRPTLVAFLAFDREKNPKLAGSGFVMAGASDMAIIITAKHVLGGVHSIQRPIPMHADSAHFVPKRATIPSLEAEQLKIVWMGEQSANLLNVNHANYNDSTDLACCIVTSQELHSLSFTPTSIPLQVITPKLGDLVHMVSLEKLDVTELAAPIDSDGRGQEIRLTQKVSVRIGTVTGVYPKHFRQYKWPCFTTSIPAEPGMSGGFVYVPTDGSPIAACGIVCADTSSHEARVNNYQAGESVIACSWPGLALRIPVSIPATSASPDRTLLDMMRAGNLDPAIGGIDHIDIIEHHDGNYKIEVRNL